MSRIIFKHISAQCGLAKWTHNISHHKYQSSHVFYSGNDLRQQTLILQISRVMVREMTG